MIVNDLARGISRRWGSLGLTLVFGALLCVHAGCKTGGGGPVSVPMEFRPNHADPISSAIAAVDVKVHLEPVADKRQEKETIGRNIEDADEGRAPIPIYSAGKQPAEFVHDVLEDELKDAGLELTDAPEAADRIISLELTKFWCEEENTYRAEVHAIAQVRDKGGRVLWKERVAGDGRNGGRSLNPVNYQEALSDATREMIRQLLINPKFQAALTR